MFAHPATHHFGRTYTGNDPSVYHTTSKKNLNKENPGGGGGLPSKTPSRLTSKNGVPGTSIRLGLGTKSVLRDGNVLRGGQGGPDKGKGKEEEIEPKRLFASTAGPLKSSLAPSKSFSSFPSIPSTVQRTTKTPATARTKGVNLRTPAPPSFPPPTPLASATRTRRRSRQSLTPLKQTQPVEFKTPAPSGKWDEELSLGSIEGLEGLDEVQEVEEVDDEDEVEYMPPPLPEIPFEPHYELPDLKYAFGVLSKVPRLWRPYEDVPPPTVEIKLVEEPEYGLELCDDEMLEEPLFRKPVPVPTPQATSNQATISKTRPTQTITTKVVPTRSVARPISTLDRPTAVRPVTKPPVTTPRSTSTKPAIPGRKTPATMFLARPTAPVPKSTARPAPTPIINIDVPVIPLPEVDVEDEEFSLDI